LPIVTGKVKIEQTRGEYLPYGRINLCTAQWNFNGTNNFCIFLEVHLQALNRKYVGPCLEGGSTGLIFLYCVKNKKDTSKHFVGRDERSRLSSAI